ncbi:MAG: HNH endonuclease [Melioribacteraceae bacterium]|nr:HNH endonuclease [Melioribacteraceae bacterium]
MNDKYDKNEKEKKIIDLYKTGTIIKNIVKELSISETTIWRILKKNNVERDRINIKLNADEVSGLYLSGKSAKFIGNVYNISEPVILRILRDNGIKIRDKVECQNGADKELILKLYQDGKSSSEIKLITGYSYSVIYKWLSHYGVRLETNQPKVPVKDIVETYSIEKNASETGRKLGIDTHTVIKHLLKSGIEIKENIVRGEKHPRWKGGITPRIELLRSSKEYRKWKKEVLTRDNFSCKMPDCNKKTDKMNVHYIIPIYMDDTKIFEVDNGITLCQECHRKIHFKEEELVDLFKGIINKC